MDDKDIISLYFDRDEQAIDETKSRYYGYCRSIAASILDSAQDIEECLSDTFMRAWNSIPPARPERLGAYLGRITRNAALNTARQQNRLKRGGGLCDAALCELEECLPDIATVDRQIDSKEISRAINDFLRTLPDEQRIIFVRRYWYFDSVADISARFGISQSKVKSILYRTRNKLRARLESEGICV